MFSGVFNSAPHMLCYSSTCMCIKEEDVSNVDRDSFENVVTILADSDEYCDSLSSANYF